MIVKVVHYGLSVVYFDRWLGVRVRETRIVRQTPVPAATLLPPWTTVHWRWLEPAALLSQNLGCGVKRASFLHPHLHCHVPPTTRRRASSSASRTGSQHPRWRRWCSPCPRSDSASCPTFLFSGWAEKERWSLNLGLKCFQAWLSSCVVLVELARPYVCLSLCVCVIHHDLIICVGLAIASIHPLQLSLELRWWIFWYDCNLTSHLHPPGRLDTIPDWCLMLIHCQADRDMGKRACKSSSTLPPRNQTWDLWVMSWLC